MKKVQKPKVSIIIPVVRQDKVKECIKAIKLNANVPEADYEIITEVDTELIGCPKMIKKMVEKAQGEMICFVGDDTLPQKNFLKKAMYAMSLIPDGWGLITFNDNPTTTFSFSHWLAHKKLLPEIGGEFFHTGYNHSFCDNELLLRCQILERHIYAYDVIIKHGHPMFDKSLGGNAFERIENSPDPHYKRAYKKYIHDKELYQKRQREIILIAQGRNI